jgi:beta-glucosidase
MTDWFSTRKDQTTEGCINAGLSLEMPWPFKYKVKLLKKACNEGILTDKTLNDLVRKNLRVMMLTGAIGDAKALPRGSRNTAQHHDLARRAAEEGMVLLKNNGNLLPLDMETIDRIALLGPNLKKKFGGFLKGGSSGVKPPFEITPLAGMKEKCKGKIKIVTDASQADLAIIFAGLDNGKGGDSEFEDRTSLDLPADQIALINRTAATNPNTIVVLIAGSPIAMDDWLEAVPVVLEAWYSGMEGGRAIANVLFGDVNPSGRLPLTFPKKLTDSPAFGMSYTTFEYGSIHLNKESITHTDDAFIVELDVMNAGESSGTEVVQVYSRDIQVSVERPQKELVGFGKIRLKAGEKRTVSITVRAEDLAFYDIHKHEWVVEPGDFEILVGRSAQDILTKAMLSYA